MEKEKMVNLEVSDEMAEEINKLLETEQFKGWSASEVVRYLIEQGLRNNG